VFRKDGDEETHSKIKTSNRKTHSKIRHLEGENKTTAKKWAAEILLDVKTFQ